MHYSWQYIYSTCIIGTILCSDINVAFHFLSFVFFLFHFNRKIWQTHQLALLLHSSFVTSCDGKVKKESPTSKQISAATVGLCTIWQGFYGSHSNTWGLQDHRYSVLFLHWSCKNTHHTWITDTSTQIRYLYYSMTTHVLLCVVTCIIGNRTLVGFTINNIVAG